MHHTRPKGGMQALYTFFMREQFDESLGLYYRMNEWFPGRTTLVFIHGLSGSSSVWPPFEAWFGVKFNTLAIDIRGHGKSRKWPHDSDYPPASSAADIDALLEKLHAGEYIAIGHSFGSLIVADLVARRRNDLCGVVLISGVYELRSRGRFRTLAFVLDILCPLIDAFPVRPTAGFHVDYARFYARTGDWNVRRISVDVLNTGIRPYLYSLRHALANDTVWENFNVPTLLVHGSADSYIPFERARELASKTGYSCRILPGCNHVVPMNGSVRVCRAIEEFLAHEHLGT